MDVICAYKSRVPWLCLICLRFVPWLCLMCLRGLRIEELKWLDMGLRCKRLDMGWKANSLDMGLRWQKGLTGGWDCWDGQKAGLAWLAIARLLQMAKGWHLGWDAKRLDLLVEMPRDLTCFTCLTCHLKLASSLEEVLDAIFMAHTYTHKSTLSFSLSLSHASHTHTHTTQA